MIMKIAEILAYLSAEGIPFSFEGNRDGDVERFSSLTHYKPGTFTWIKKQENIPPELEQAAVTLVFCPEEVRGDFPNVIHTSESKKAFFSCMEHFYGEKEREPGIGAYTYLAPTVKLGRDVRIGCGCTLDGEITVGDGVTIGNHVTMIHRVTVGAGTEIRSGVVIGHDDSISYTEDARHKKTNVKHFGGVTIGEDVLIGENSVICRGTIDDTVIGDGVRIDALTQVSHNCILEENSVLVAGCRLCGSVHLQKNAYLAGAIVRNQCVVEQDAFAGLGAVVVKNIPAGETVVGNPAKPMKKKEV